MEITIGKVWQSPHFSADIFLFDVVVGPLTMTFAVENFYSALPQNVRIIPPTYIESGNYTKLRPDGLFLRRVAELIHAQRDLMLTEEQHKQLHEFQLNKGMREPKY